MKAQVYIILIPLLFSFQQISNGMEPPELEVGPIINQSYNFLKEREPEMTEAEYALYEQVIPMVFSMTDQAIVLLEAMIADDEPESAAFSFVLGNVYFSANRLELAEKNFLLAVSGYPEFIRAWENLAILYYTKQNYVDAQRCFVKAIELGASGAQIQGLLGYCLIKNNNTIAAEAAFMQAMAKEPSNADWCDALLSLYIDSEQYLRAEAILLSILQMNPEKSSYWQLLSNVLVSGGDKMKAITFLETAKQLGYANDSMLLILGDLYAEKKLYQEAIESYQQGVELNSISGTERILTLVSALIEEEQFMLAKQLIREQEGNIPASLLGRFHFANSRIYYEQGEYTEARSLLQQTLEQDPLHGRALIYLAKIHKNEGDFESADFYLRQASHIESCQFESFIEIADVALKRKQYGDSIRFLEKALSIEYREDLDDIVKKLRQLM